MSGAVFGRLRSATWALLSERALACKTSQINLVYYTGREKLKNQRHGSLLKLVEPGVFAFDTSVTRATVEKTGDEVLLELFKRTERYEGKGCLNAVDHVHEFAAPFFEDKDVANWGLFEIDQALLKLELSTAKRREKLSDDATKDTEIRLMQRKQNLGMNAILSISLALARGVANVRGQELYEFLREEMLIIIEALASKHQVAIEGSLFDDYLAALRAVNIKLEAQGLLLYEALREVTGIYHRAGDHVMATAPFSQSVMGITDDEVPFSKQESEHISSLNRTLVDDI